MMGNSLSRYGTGFISKNPRNTLNHHSLKKNILACSYTRQNIYRSENHISPSPLKLLLFVFALSRHLNLLLTYIFLSFFSPPIWHWPIFVPFPQGEYVFLLPGNMCSFYRGRGGICSFSPIGDICSFSPPPPPGGGGGFGFFF